MQTSISFFLYKFHCLNQSLQIKDQSSINQQMFICGSGSFGREEENERYTSPCSTPKRSKKNTNSFCKLGKLDSTNRNPYAGRGLDKFNALLAELDDKKQRIYTKVGPDEISLVRFVYPNDSDQVRPIVVKAKERNREKSTQGPVSTGPAVVENAAAGRDKEAKKSSGSTDLKLEDYLRRPYFYFPLTLVLILMFLVVYGRSFAILCTTIGWYLVPSVDGGNLKSPSSSNMRKLKRKKELSRKFSERKMVNGEGSSSPISVLNGVNGDKSPLEQEMGRRRSF